MMNQGDPRFAPRVELPIHPQYRVTEGIAEFLLTFPVGLRQYS